MRNACLLSVVGLLLGYGPNLGDIVTLEYQTAAHRVGHDFTRKHRRATRTTIRCNLFGTLYNSMCDGLKSGGRIAVAVIDIML